jgi:DNA-binding response OmpR family regulator
MIAGKRILIADHDRLILATLKSGLTNAGYDVVEAATGAEAIQQCEEAEPHLAIFDIKLPDCSGI